MAIRTALVPCLLAPFLLFSAAGDAAHGPTLEIEGPTHAPLLVNFTNNSSSNVQFGGDFSLVVRNADLRGDPSLRAFAGTLDSNGAYIDATVPNVSASVQEWMIQRVWKINFDAPSQPFTQVLFGAGVGKEPTVQAVATGFVYVDPSHSGDAPSYGFRLSTGPLPDEPKAAPADPPSGSDPRGPAVLEVVALTGVVAISLAVFGWPRRNRGLVLLGTIPFQRREQAKKEMLMNDNRRRLYEAIHEAPRARMAELMARTELAEGVLRHHLLVLRRAGFVLRVTEDGVHHYVLPEDQHLVPSNPPKKPGIREIIRSIVEREGAPSAKEIARRCGRSPRAVRDHLHKLEDDRVVEGTYVSREKQWRWSLRE